MPLTALKKRSQVDNDPQDRNLIKSVLEIINTPVNQETKKEASDEGSNKSNLPKDVSKIVLQIDDDDDDREFVAEVIKSIDPSFILHEAQNGEDGITYLNNAKSSGNLPCLIILDINMPGMDGIDTYNEIKKDYTLNAIPTVIFTTTAVFKDTQTQEIEKLPIFIKPGNTRDFKAAVKKILTHCKD